MEHELRRMFEVKEIEMTVPPTLSPELRSQIGRQRMVIGGLVAAAACALVIGGFAGAQSLRSDDAAPLPPAAERKQEIEQVPAIRQVVDAINARDAGAFIEVFAREGAYSPRGTFEASSGIINNFHPVADAHLVDAWMAIHEAWRLEVELIACNELDFARYGRFSSKSDVLIQCEVATRWHRLSLEMREGWLFDFDGMKLLHADLAHANPEQLDLNPGRRVLPLGYDDLQKWEEWLKATHPDDAARYLNPRATEAGPCEDNSCQRLWDSTGDRLAPLLWDAKKEWSIEGFRFRPTGLIPYDPAFADEIEASLQAYLAGL